MIRGMRSRWIAGCAFGVALGAPGVGLADWGAVQPSSDVRVMESAQGTPGVTSTCMTATPCVNAPSQGGEQAPEHPDSAHSQYEPATSRDAPADEAARPYEQSQYQLGAGHQD